MLVAQILKTYVSAAVPETTEANSNFPILIKFFCVGNIMSTILNWASSSTLRNLSSVHGFFCSSYSSSNSSSGFPSTHTTTSTPVQMDWEMDWQMKKDGKAQDDRAQPRPVQVSVNVLVAMTTRVRTGYLGTDKGGDRGGSQKWLLFLRLRIQAL